MWSKGLNGIVDDAADNIQLRLVVEELVRYLHWQSVLSAIGGKLAGHATQEVCPARDWY